ncbi:Hypothetical protein, putative [Bodo saltans]|uniref:DUF2779 domain-containing protein n=1 Tax=Bodo saltans TaxID=75058 RepID=A0A0S4IQ45_BODSA|nr:Hypothetical protein, putative [Bodo saltans]|eukprot:CUF92519.1 Hypothetical protein, putative [Bodo saltans]
MRALPILKPPTLAKPDPQRNAMRPLSISQVVRMQDSVEFRELCYMWDRNTTNTKAVLVRESDFEQAHVKTTEIVNQYFDVTLKQLGKGAPPLTLHRPAIRSLYTAVPSSNPSTSRVIELRSRPSILHFYPKLNEWRIYSPSAVTDPLSDKFRAEWLLQSMLFDMCVLKGWQGTTPLLSQNAKEYLKSWTFGNSSTTTATPSTTEVSMRSDKSGVLSIRPYISGPLTLQHHDTYTLSQFVLKTVQYEIAKRVAPTGSKSSTTSTADVAAAAVEPWDLDAGMASMMLHIRSASEILTGAIDERRRKLWSALSRDDRGSVEADPGREPPYAALLSSICKKETVDCPLYSAGNCLPMKEPAAQDSKTTSTVFDMPGLNIDKKSALWAANVRTLKDIAATKASTAASSSVPAVKLSPSQSRFLDAHVHDHISVNPTEIKRWFSSLQYPVFMLDFEAVQFALPPFEQSKPYQAIPFQFSLDVFHHDVLTETPVHYEFLYIEEPNCNTFADPRSICITKLMDAIRKERKIAQERMTSNASAQDNEEERLKKGKAKAFTEGKMIKGLYSSENRKLSVQPWEGTVVAHFATYEKNVLQKASLLLPQFRDEIVNMLFLDTIDLARGGLVHPATNGSTSLKKLVPALLSKEDQYQAFSNVAASSDDGDSQDSAADGSSAAALYRVWRQKGAADLTLVKELQDAKAEAERLGWSKVRSQLLQYCNADTRNMYLVVRAIHKLMEESRARGDSYDPEGWSIPNVNSSTLPTPQSLDLAKPVRTPSAPKTKSTPATPKAADRKSVGTKPRGRKPKN